MANHYSALKRVREDKKRTLANAAQALLPKAFSMIDRAARLGVVKKNAAARYKSRLHARLKSLTAPAAA